MANIKSAKKTYFSKQNKGRAQQSDQIQCKDCCQKVEAAVAAKDKEAAAAALLNATSVIDKATTKGVYHKNTSARKVSRLSKAVNSIA